MSGEVRLVTMLLAKVISSPSSTQAMPRAKISRVWKRDHGSRSRRAGISVFTERDPLERSIVLLVMEDLRCSDGDGDA